MSGPKKTTGLIRGDMAWDGAEVAVLVEADRDGGCDWLTLCSLECGEDDPTPLLPPIQDDGKGLRRQALLAAAHSMTAVGEESLAESEVSILECELSVAESRLLAASEAIDRLRIALEAELALIPLFSREPEGLDRAERLRRALEGVIA